MPSTNAPLKIAIVGAGMAGLAVARTLQQNGIPCTVYDLDISSTSRDQGGSLDLHVESGQLAMRTNGLWDGIQRHMRYEGQDTRLLDKNGKVWLDKVAEEGEARRPEVDRGPLRQIYIDSLEEGTIRWGTRITKVTSVTAQDGEGEQIKHPRYTLHFGDGTEETFDFVVGADGAWSRVRPLLSDAKPTYSGVTFHEMRLPNADKDHPDESKLVGRGSLYTLSDNKAILGQRNGNAFVRIYAVLRVPESGLPEEIRRDESSARAYILKHYEDWSEGLQNLIRNSQGFIPRPIYALPVEHRWVSRPGITVIGDAAHLMSPFAGEGANLAMIDGVDLGLTLVKVVKDGEDLAVAQQNFEQAMLTRSKVAAEASARNLELFFSENGPENALGVLSTMYLKKQN
ncbi:hypothetical protein EC973_000475 [Apophysomyces ossiformis]|uniref:FAD-binding domain-containing protein n=1 Tax=Apophysomyces ossiformis TaxID=679940 RepID=A0A8H7BQF1_9FUNG|nr:hypothetical protein EC973_000475 [Apophysomyces ossiformis]